MTTKRRAVEIVVKYDELMEILNHHPFTLESYELVTELLEDVEYRLRKETSINLNFVQITELNVYLQELQHQLKTAFMFKNTNAIEESKILLDNLVTSLASSKLSESPKTKTIIMQLKRLIPVILSPYCLVDSLEAKETFDLVKDHILDLRLQNLITSSYIYPDMDYDNFRLETLEQEEKTDLMNVYLQLTD